MERDQDQPEFSTCPVRVTEKLDVSRCQMIHNQSDSGDTRLSRRDNTCNARSRLRFKYRRLLSYLLGSPCLIITLAVLVQRSESALSDNQAAASSKKAGQASHAQGSCQAESCDPRGNPHCAHENRSLLRTFKRSTDRSLPLHSGDHLDSHQRPRQDCG